MADDNHPEKPEGGGNNTTPREEDVPQWPSIDERPSSEFLGEEKWRVSIFNPDSDDSTVALPDLGDKGSLPSYCEDEDDDEEAILPAWLTEAWQEKAQLSKECTSAPAAEADESKETQVDEPVADDKPHRGSRISSAGFRCSQCGHYRRDSMRSSTTFGNGPQLPTEHQHESCLRRPASLSLFPRTRPPSPLSTQRAFPLSVKRVPSKAVSDAQTFYSAQEGEGVNSPEPHSETASVISSIFATPLRHLASNPSLRGSLSTDTATSEEQRVTPIAEQRHPGKAGARISRFTRPFEPDIDEEDDGSGYRRQVMDMEVVRAEKQGSELTQTADGKDEKEEWVEGWRLAFLLLGICLVVFLISVDRTILTTAIPYITSEFQSTADIGWYGSAYLLTACAFQPVFGRVFMLFSIKWSYMLAMFMFLVGSLICGLAPNSVALIVGRAVAGFGSAGILTGSFVVVAMAVPLRLRPIYTAIVGLMFGLGATVSPLLGGVFTDLVTWRWCFYINLPVGGVTVLVFLLFLHPQRRPRHEQTFFDRFMDLDIVGNVLLLGACVMLFLVLEFTAQGEAWSSPRVAGLLASAGATAAVFAAWQWWKQDGALIPPAIVTQRTVAASCVAAFATYGALLIHSYFLPLWFQAVKGESATSSGVDMIPYVATNALFSLFSGFFVSVVGYFVPPAVVGGVIATAGCGVFLLLSQDSPTTQWIGFEILVSAGFGMSIQQGFTAVQAILPPDDISIGTAAVVASQSLGGAIFISVGNTLFQNHLLQASAQNMVPGVDIRAVLEGGATAFRDVVPASALPMMLTVYNEALRVAFTAAIPLAGVSVIAACFMEWKSVKGKKAG
ncbi:major facilitator superfamily transporter [Colletotrichum graminicola]|uniref:Major facilitator superfamily transporter n=1 Tax=Colletotrichum graminicola (strain M1.001 / M2 / FGSC 10212) TaxID=645133 RepID=E3QIW4_COLGM|nr:major facilitator superfamily transporter [Colletotrichum graminicola M1.001]EFQ30802.1 major facilitator superfamily transporter [Colletotrichum graminicola M1.001]WDK21560.1 major facilitator superfamily transporter [Colletotrichum graminicola]